MRTLIDRPIYLEQLVEHKDVDLIKIITGIRRCGKSSILALYHEYLVKHGVDESHIVHINLESMRFRTITDAVGLYEYVTSKMSGQGRMYLLFDELQVVSHWEKAIESFRLDYDVDIYITGSNAYFLSSELSTYLSGRYVEIRVLPLSFKEFLTFHNLDTERELESSFLKYMTYGGMPILCDYAFKEQQSMEALEGIYSTVILRDVLQRNGPLNQHALHKIVMFLCSNIGSATSPNNIGNVLNHEGDMLPVKEKNIAGKTVDKYITLLKNAFVIYSAERYDLKGKQLLQTLEKQYLVDLGFRTMLLGRRDADRGHLLENIVYLELLRRNYTVHIGKIGDLEIDFVAEKSNEKIYIQVTESMDSPETRMRELRPFSKLTDHYPKMVLSMDRDYNASYDGVCSTNIIDWLLK